MVEQTAPLQSGDTCTKHIVPAGSYGAFHTYPCGRKPITRDQQGEPRCGIHGPAKAEAKRQKWEAEFNAKREVERQAAQAQWLRDAKAAAFDDLLAALETLVHDAHNENGVLLDAENLHAVFRAHLPGLRTELAKVRAEV